MVDAGAHSGLGKVIINVPPSLLSAAASAVIVLRPEEPDDGVHPPHILQAALNYRAQRFHPYYVLNVAGVI